MALPILRFATARHFALLASCVGVAALPGTAFAQCAATGSNVTCTGASPAYTNTGTGVAVTVSSGATVTAPLIIGNNGSLSNSGIITGSTGVVSVQYADNAQITNASGATISSTAALTGAGAISVGANSVVTNNGTLTAAGGTPVVQFNTNGTFINTTSAPIAVTGNVLFGDNTGANVANFTNNNLTYGFTGNVAAGGNININNTGLYTGNFIQTAKLGSVSFTNATGGIYSGVIAIGDQATVVNNGTMFLYTGSTINSLGAGLSSFRNTGILTIGAITAPAQVRINGSFTQSAAGNLVIAIAPAGALAATAGGNYSQIYASGTNGTANLAGTITLNVQAGFYPTGSLYNVVLADHGITGNFSTISGNTLPFVTFSPVGANGIVTTSGAQQAYEFVATHTSNYAAALTAGAVAAGVAAPTANELAVANGLNPLVAVASAAPAGNEAAFLGAIDVLNQAAATTALDGLSPEGYFAYAVALRDQANAFTRTIDLRLNDQNSNHGEDGWWLTPQYSIDVASQSQTTNGNYRSKAKMFGFSGGYDFSGPQYVFGAAANFSNDSLNYAPGSLKGKNRDLAVALYGGANLGPLHLTGQVGYNFGRLSAAKTVTLGTTTTTTVNGTTSTTTTTPNATLSLAGKASEHLLKASGSVGIQLKAGGVMLEPFVGIEYMNGKVNGFTEAGNAAAALTVSAINANRTDAVAGINLTRATGTFRPYVRAAYRSRIGTGPAANVTAYFGAASGSPFTVTALDSAKTELDLNAGINWVFDDAGTLFLGYQGTLRDGYKSHGINLGVRIEF